MSYEYIKPTSHWKHKPRRRVRFPRFLFRRGLIKTAFLLFLIFLVGGALFSLAAFAWVSRDLPNPNALLTRDVAQSTKIYDRTGEHLLYEIHGSKNRTLVKLEDIPDLVKQATLSVEDQQFYNHKGFNPVRVVKGLVWGMITKGRPQGGSTITQQLVKNAILTNERSITRKIKELILSIAIEQRFTKDQILQLYLNEIPYGSTNYGVEAASGAYFGKTVKDLTLAEAATLAALPKAPSTYLNNPNKLDARRDVVLKLMFEEGYITEEEKITAQAETVTMRQDALVEDGAQETSALHFVFYIKELLIEQYGLDERKVEEGGLKVTTTLDYDKQLAAEQAIKNGIAAKGDAYRFHDGALVSLDPKTGQVLAMVGSPDYFNEEIDGAVNMAVAPIQPGSSFKPIAYAAGFLAGYTPNTILYDVVTTFKTEVSDYTPYNYHAEMEAGPVTIRKALQGSLNIPAVKMVMLVGLDRIFDFSELLGYTTFADRAKFGPSIVLGGGEVKLIEHAAAYGAFANDGILQKTSAVLKVEDADKNTIYEWKADPGKRVMEEGIARQINNVLSDNAARAYIFGASNHLTLSDRPVAAKTGTTNDNHAALTVGYTPSLVAGVWVGNADYSAMMAGADGSVVAAPIWKEYMQKALSGTTAENFIAPEIPMTGKAILDGTIPSTTVVIDKSTGKLATDQTPESMKENLSCGEYHSELYYINPADPRGAEPGDQPDNAQYVSWEAGIKTWVDRLTLTDPSKLPFESCAVPTEEDDVHTRQNRPGIDITSPKNNSTVSGRSFKVEVDATARRGITRVEYAIDGKLVTSSSSDSGTTIVLPSWVGTGKHTLTATAYDDVDNNQSDEISITITKKAVGSSLELIDPINEQTIEKTSPSYNVIIQLSDPSSTSNLNLYAKPLNGGASELVGSVASPSTTFTTFVWTLPNAGTYLLFAQAEDENGTNLDSGQTKVFVKDDSSSSTVLNLIGTEPTDTTAVPAEVVPTP